MRYILQCEDSIEGIFSAVYAAWELKYGHENTSIRVTGYGNQNLELFTQYIHLTPDAKKAFTTLSASLHIKGKLSLFALI